MRPSFFVHLHPPNIPEAQARWRYTLGAGGLAILLTVVVLISGVLLSFYYIPFPKEAALSIQRITFRVPYGSLLRNLHYWSAQALVIVSLIHLCRVIFTGAYAPPRRFNYLLGLCLFLFMIWEDFSGYILRWDEGIRWALIVATNLVQTIPVIGMYLYRFIIGGDHISQETLIRFNAWHSFGLFLPLAFGIGWHLFRVRRDGGIAAPSTSTRSHLTPYPRNVERKRIKRVVLVQREGGAAIICLAVLILWANVFPAPIEQPMDLNNLAAAEANAPWFFLWVQHLLSLGNPFLWGILIPTCLFLAIGAIPFITPLPRPQEVGRWFPASARIAQIGYISLMVFMIMLTLLALKNRLSI